MVNDKQLHDEPDFCFDSQAETYHVSVRLAFFLLFPSRLQTNEIRYAFVSAEVPRLVALSTVTGVVESITGRGCLGSPLVCKLIAVYDRSMK